LAEHCASLEAGCALTQEVLAQVRHPFALLPVRLIEQNTAAGTTFLRWQSVQGGADVGVWAQMVHAPKTPIHLLQDLLPWSNTESP
jgi:hypothetical protein